jgi:hypothetical protein
MDYESDHWHGLIYRMSNIAITNSNITHSYTYLACSHLLAFRIQARSVYPQQTVQYYDI